MSVKASSLLGSAANNSHQQFARGLRQSQERAPSKEQKILQEAALAASSEGTKTLRGRASTASAGSSVPETGVLPQGVEAAASAPSQSPSPQREGVAVPLIEGPRVIEGEARNRRPLARMLRIFNNTLMGIGVVVLGTAIVSKKKSLGRSMDELFAMTVEELLMMKPTAPPTFFERGCRVLHLQSDGVRQGAFQCFAGLSTLFIFRTFFRGIGML